MTSHLLLSNALVLFAYMTLAYWVGRSRRRLDTVDAAWGIGFIMTAWLVVGLYPTDRSLLVAALVSIWGIRLTWHLGKRSWTRPQEDSRYVAISDKWKGNKWRRAYVSIFLLQGALIWLITLPVLLVANPSLSGVRWLVPLGILLWGIGFAIESVADHQLAHFVHNPRHQGKVLQTGLWRYSRHPNYFGEILQWIGIGTIATSTSYGWIGWLGPLTLLFLILFVSGIPPIENRHKHDPLYQDYRRHTSVLIPLPRH